MFRPPHLFYQITSDHTPILRKLDVSVPLQEPETFLYRCLKKIDTNTFKQNFYDVISPNSSVTDYNNHLRFVLDKQPLSAIAHPVRGSRHPGSAVSRSSSAS